MHYNRLVAGKFGLILTIYVYRIQSVLLICVDIRESPHAIPVNLIKC